METFSMLLALLQGIHRSPVNPLHKGQWRGTLMFSSICAWTNDLVNNRDAGDLRRHYAVTVMLTVISEFQSALATILYNGFKIFLLLKSLPQLPGTSELTPLTLDQYHSDTTTIWKNICFIRNITIHIKAFNECTRYHWSFVRGIHRSHVDSPIKRPVFWGFDIFVVILHKLLNKQ